MFQKSAFLGLFPLALLLCLSPIIFASDISDLSKGAVIGVFLGLALPALIKGKRKAR
ncbi:hypothetical protein LIHA111178_12060 [Litorimonas haliclonae]